MYPKVYNTRAKKVIKSKSMRFELNLSHQFYVKLNNHRRLWSMNETKLTQMYDFDVN